MGNKPFPRSNQQHQQPYTQNGQAPETAPVSTSAPIVPVVAWPDDETRQTVVKTNEAAWHENDRALRAHRQESARLDSEIGRMSRDFEELRKRIGDAIETKKREDHYGDQRERARDGFAIALTAVGEQVPSSVDGVKVAPFHGDDPSPTGTYFQRDPYAGQVPDGYCNQCGQPVWRGPSGVTHQHGKLCNPGQETSTEATLPDDAGALS